MTQDKQTRTKIPEGVTKLTNTTTGEEFEASGSIKKYFERKEEEWEIVPTELLQRIDVALEDYRHQLSCRYKGMVLEPEYLKERVLNNIYELDSLRKQLSEVV